MPATYLFSKDGLGALVGYLNDATLFAFDLDGTLAPIVEEFSAARISVSVKKTLARLAALAKVAVITGRSRTDALNILGFEPHLVVGNHGAEWPEVMGEQNRQFGSICTGWRNQLQVELSRVQGIELEFKGASLSIHYRKASDLNYAVASISRAIGMLDPTPNIVGGKFVFNILPTDAPTKGDALKSAMALLGTHRAVYFGDDVTDEEVFKRRDIDLFGVRIGADGETAASYYIKKQSALLGLLNSIVGILESQRTLPPSAPSPP